VIAWGVAPLRSPEVLYTPPSSGTMVERRGQAVRVSSTTGAGADQQEEPPAGPTRTALLPVMVMAEVHTRRGAATQRRYRLGNSSHIEPPALGPGQHAAMSGDRETGRGRGRGRERERKGRRGEGSCEGSAPGEGVGVRARTRDWGEAGVHILLSGFEAEAGEAGENKEKSLWEKSGSKQSEPHDSRSDGQNNLG
jgi:hypothetical protein